MKDYKDLQVWQRSIDFVVEIYTLVKALPAEETYALSDQMRRAAVSIPSNIAEGMERSAVKEKLHFLSIATGSLAEIETQLIICSRLGFINQATLKHQLDDVVTIQKMLYKLSASLKTRLTTSHQPPATNHDG